MLGFSSPFCCCCFHTTMRPSTSKKPCDGHCRRTRSRGPVGHRPDGFFQRQKGNQCLMVAVNNLLGREEFKPADFENRRERCKKRHFKAGFDMACYRKRTTKGKPGMWCVTLAVDALQSRGYKVTAIRANALTTATREAAKKGKKLLVGVTTKKGFSHAIAVKEREIYDGTLRGPVTVTKKACKKLMPLVFKSWLVEEK